MDLGAIFLLLAVILLVGIYISRPLFSNQRSEGSLQAGHQPNPTADSQDRLRSSLLAEYDRTLNALQELEFDFTLGKIPEGEFPEQRAQLLKAGADVLRQLDSLAPAGPALSESAELAEDRIEAAVSARRAARVESRPAAAVTEISSDDDLEALIASRRRARQEKTGGFCPRCGKPTLLSDRFCPKCGTSLKA
jgi:hypothetical protein